MTGRWLVIGARGQLGVDLVAALPGEDVVALDQAELDVTDVGAVAAALSELRPSVVLNVAGYTAVDAAETDREAAFAVNATAPGLLAAGCAQLGATLVHVSTDYVFAGDATTPYREDAPASPRSVYGRSKLDGERRVRAVLAKHYVVRTAWLYGAAGDNFVKTIARLERQRETLHVVDDQRGSPTWSAELARGLVALARSGAPYGTYHCTASGSTTWWGLARAVFEELGADPDRVLPCTTSRFPRPAPRPAYSVLSDAAWRAAGLAPLPPWRQQLAAAFAAHGDALRGP